MYDQAKLHLQICMSYYAPGLAHNHVHFVFPSSLCVLSKTMLNRSGVLWKLLSPHFRFTEGINQQALRIGKATSNKNSIIDKLFYTWQPFPLTNEEFTEGVAWKCKEYYMEKGALKPDSADQTDRGASSSSDDTDDDANDEDSRDMRARTHTLFPPEFVTDKKLSKIPYLRFLKGYYKIVRKFVVRIAPLIDRKEWKLFSAEITKHVPRYRDANMIDAITTFIHQAAITHFCDHHSYLDFFAWEYGCIAFRFPFEDYEKRRHWDPALRLRRGRKMTVDDVMANPERLVRKRDIARTRCFYNIFVDYIPNPKCPMETIKTQYNFAEDEANDAALEFMSDLRNHDSHLKETRSPMNFQQQPGEKRADGLQIVELHRMVRSVCY